MYLLVYECISSHSKYTYTSCRLIYTVHCTLYSVHCTLYTVHCIMYTVHFIMYNVHYSLLNNRGYCFVNIVSSLHRKIPYISE